MIKKYQNGIYLNPRVYAEEVNITSNKMMKSRKKKQQS